MSRTRVLRPAIYSSMASDPMLADLVAEFVAEMPNRVARLKRQYSAQDRVGLRSTAHQLKGAAGSYGFDEITPLALHLEMQLDQGAETKDISRALQELVAHCQRITAVPPQ